LRELGPLIATLVPAATLQDHAFFALQTWLCNPDRVTIGGESAPLYRADSFHKGLEQSKTDLQGAVYRTVQLLREIFALRQTLLVDPRPYPGMEADLAQLVPPHFLRTTPFPQLAHFPRYLRAMKARADRWKANPAKDAERAAQLAPYVRALASLAKSTSTDGVKNEHRQRLRWLVEEFRVSLFAQELGTAQPVSAVKLDRALEELKQSAAAGNVNQPNSDSSKRSAEPPSARPIAAPEKKAAPLKNLSGLDRLFQR
jgi:ATP-dependent helicase HrpA